MNPFYAPPVILLCSIFSFSYAQTGLPDSTFGDEGFFRYSTNFTYESASDIALTNDGKILCTVDDYNYIGFPSLVRFMIDGSIDSSFGKNGKIDLADEEAFESFTASALEVDLLNRILVFVEDNTDEFPKTYVHRYLEDGTPDPLFDGNGVVKTKLDYGQNALAIQDDGKIVIGGGNSNGDGRVQRLNEDGNNDPSFGGQGYVNLTGCKIFGLTIDNYNRILVTGISGSDLLITRLMSDGSPDIDFGNGGSVIIDEGKTEGGECIHLTIDGKIVVAGFAEQNVESEIRCWRLLDSGVLDASFGINGTVSLYSGPFSNRAWFILPDENGSVIIGGNQFNGVNYDPVIYKILDDGSIDLDFGNNGVSGQSFSCKSTIEISAVKTSDNTILICGSKWSEGNNQMAISGFLPGGETDQSFGDSGTVTMRFNDTGVYLIDRIYDFTALPDGSILTAGQSNDLTMFRLMENGTLDQFYNIDGLWVSDRPSESSCLLTNEKYDLSLVASNGEDVYLVSRYFPEYFDLQFLYNCQFNYTAFLVYKFNADGSPDKTYGMDGVIQPDIPGGLTQCSDIALQPDDKLLLTGYIHSTSSDSASIFLMRLNIDGTTDATFGISGLIMLDWPEANPQFHYPVVDLFDDGRIILGVSNCAIACFNTDGSPDFTFGVDGIVSPVSSAVANNIKVQSGYKIVYTTFSSGSESIVRLNSDGTSDISFGNNGTATCGIDFNSSEVPILAIQPDGKILYAGRNLGLGSLIVKMSEDGTIDSSFGTNGISYIPNIPGTGAFSIYSTGLQPDGKILVAGVYDGDFYMARILNDVATQVNENTHPTSMTVFPNPAHEKVTINLPFQKLDNSKLIITNSLSHVVKADDIPLNSSSKEIHTDISELHSGIYFVTVMSKDFTFTTPLIKE